MAEIDAVLAHRAEQALLGALIAGADPAVVGEVRPGDFTGPVHQALYAAITGQYRRGGPASRVRAWLARVAGLRVARAAEYAEGLPARCPERSHLLAYGAMVAEARRQGAGNQPQASAGPDGQLAGAEAWLASAAGRRRRAGARGARRPGASDDRGGLAPGTQRLARALAPAAKRLRGQVTAGRGGGGPDAGVVLAREGTGNVTGAALQELALAGLMRRPVEGRALAGLVPPGAFGSPGRQQLYTVIAQLIAQRLPVDPLIVAWQARKRAGEPAAELALRLGEVATVPGMAGLVCRGLHADYELTRAWGRDWPRQELHLGDRPPGPAAPQGLRMPGATPVAAVARPARSAKTAGPAAAQGIRRPAPPGPAAGTVPRPG